MSVNNAVIRFALPPSANWLGSSTIWLTTSSERYTANARLKKLFSFSVKLRTNTKKGWLDLGIGYKSMSKKDKKIEIQIKDAKVIVNKATLEGFELLVGKKVIGQIVEIDGKFAVVDKENVAGFHKKMDDAIAAIIEAYNLNH